MAIAATVGSAACSSMYMPQTPGRVAVILQDGKQAYVRDGQIYPNGMLGGGLVDAVAGNPTAERAAQTYHAKMQSGFTFVLLGVIAELGGLSYATAEVTTNDGRVNNNFAGGMAIALGGIVATLIGAGYLSSAEPYRWDAINLFNDGGAAPRYAPPRYMPPAQLAPPPAAPPGGVDSLHMR
nr:hypothetical protein [Kofleriaceae bacterium]